MCCDISASSPKRQTNSFPIHVTKQKRAKIITLYFWFQSVTSRWTAQWIWSTKTYKVQFRPDQPNLGLVNLWMRCLINAVVSWTTDIICCTRSFFELVQWIKPWSISTEIRATKAERSCCTLSGSNFTVCEWYSNVWSLKWKLLSSTSYGTISRRFALLSSGMTSLSVPFSVPFKWTLSSDNSP